MATSLAEIRAKLQAQENRTGGNYLSTLEHCRRFHSKSPFPTRRQFQK